MERTNGWPKVTAETRGFSSIQGALEDHELDPVILSLLKIFLDSQFKNVLQGPLSASRMPTMPFLNPVSYPKWSPERVPSDFRMFLEMGHILTREVL